MTRTITARFSVRANFLSNLFGQGWTSLLGLAFVPVYVRLLGVESYGLIGFFAVLQTWLSLLDFGMSQTLTRKIGAESGIDPDLKDSAHLLRTMEVVSILIGGAIFAVSLVSAHWIATHWLKLGKLDVKSVSTAIALMGLVCGTRFLENVYRAFLIGAQRQLSLNVITGILATIRHVGAFAVLYFYSSSIVTFFVWQAALSAVALVSFGAYVSWLVPSRSTNSTQMLSQLKGAFGFASSMAALNILALILGQLDKVLVSRLVSLEQFGYYILAATLANGLHQFTMPVAQAYFPRFAQLYFSDQKTELVAAFHMAARLVATLICAAASILILFPYEVVHVWTKDAHVAAQVAPMLSLLALATMLNGLMWIPYHLQLAAGWTGLMLKINSAAVVLVVPLLIYLVKSHGAIAAAWISVGLNAAYVLVVAHVMHSQLLKGEKGAWYRDDVLKPLATALAIACVCRLLPVWGGGYISNLFSLVATVVVVFSVTFASNPAVRHRLMSQVRRLREN